MVAYRCQLSDSMVICKSLREYSSPIVTNTQTNTSLFVLGINCYYVKKNQKNHALLENSAYLKIATVIR